MQLGLTQQETVDILHSSKHSHQMVGQQPLKTKSATSLKYSGIPVVCTTLWYSFQVQRKVFVAHDGLVNKSCLTVVTPWTVACQAPLPLGFSRQEYWSGLPFPSLGDLSKPRIKPGYLSWQKFFTNLSYEGSPTWCSYPLQLKHNPYFPGLDIYFVCYWRIPIYQRTHKPIIFECDPEHKKIFYLIQSSLWESLALCFYDPDDSVILVESVKIKILHGDCLKAWKRIPFLLKKKKIVLLANPCLMLINCSWFAAG